MRKEFRDEIGGSCARRMSEHMFFHKAVVPSWSWRVARVLFWLCWANGADAGGSTVGNRKRWKQRLCHALSRKWRMAGDSVCMYSSLKNLAMEALSVSTVVQTFVFGLFFVFRSNVEARRTWLFEGVKYCDGLMRLLWFHDHSFHGADSLNHCQDDGVYMRWFIWVWCID